MEEFRAESVRELVLILLERMRVMDLSLIEVKSHMTKKINIDVVAKLELQMKELEITVDSLQKLHEAEQIAFKTLNENKENMEKQQLAKDAVNKKIRDIIYWCLGIAGTMFVLFKTVFS